VEKLMTRPIASNTFGVLAWWASISFPKRSLGDLPVSVGVRQKDRQHEAAWRGEDGRCQQVLVERNHGLSRGLSPGTMFCLWTNYLLQVAQGHNRICDFSEGYVLVLIRFYPEPAPAICAPNQTSAK
jgi:hypothetical protein